MADEVWEVVGYRGFEELWREEFSTEDYSETQIKEIL